MTIEEATFAIVDTETTGMDETDPANEIVEVAGILVDYRGQISGEFERLVRPEGAIPPQSSGIHHLTDADVADALHWGEVHPLLDGFVPAGAIMTAHNAPYDRGMMHDTPLFNRAWLCTERLAHHVVPDAPNYKLQTLRYLFGHSDVDMRERAPHRAMGDVLVLRHVLVTLIERYTEHATAVCNGDAARFARSREIEPFLEFVWRPYVMLKLPFGKHKKDELATIPMGYLRWCLTGMDDLSSDARWNIERELKRRRTAA